MTVDPRRTPYERDDGYARATNVHPDPNSPTGWLCPACGNPACVYYGQGPEWDLSAKRYRAGTDTRVCLGCFTAAAERGAA